MDNLEQKISRKIPHQCEHCKNYFFANQGIKELHGMWLCKECRIKLQDRIIDCPDFLEQVKQ